MRRVLLRSLLVAVALAGAFGIGEIVVRIAGLAPELGELSRDGYRLSDDPAIGYEPLAFRGPAVPTARPPGRKRVVVIGDSIAAGMDVVEWEDVFSARLDARLRAAGLDVDTATFAVPGYNTSQEVATLAARGVALDPDVVVVAYCLNDRDGLDRRIVTTLEHEGARLPGAIRASALARLFWFGLVDRRQPEEGTIGGDTRAAAFARLEALARTHGFRVVVAVFPLFVDLYRYRSDDAHAEVAAFCERHGFARVDLLEPMRRAGGTLATDHFHPNARGHDIAAAAVARVVGPMLGAASDRGDATAAVVRGVDHRPARIDAATRVAVTAFVGGRDGDVARVRVRVGDRERTLPLVDDGRHADGEAGDGVGGAWIEPEPGGTVVRYTVEVGPPDAAPVASASGSYIVALPTDRRGAMLSEIAMRGDGTAWIELLNPDDTPIALDALRLTDDPTRPDRWRVGRGTLAPGATHVVDGVAVAPGPLALFGDDGRTMLDHVTLPPHGPGSIGRLGARRPRDREPDYVRLLAPSRGAANDADPAPRAYTAFDASTLPLALAVRGTPTPGATIEFVVTGAPADGACRVLIALAPLDEPLLRSRGRRLVATPHLAALAADADAEGTAVMPFELPDHADTRGVRIFAQAWCDREIDRIASHALTFTVR